MDIQTKLENNNINSIKLFQLIKSHKYSVVEEFIKDNPNFNYNIQENKVYFLEYVILFGRIKILSLLLKLNIQLDIRDENNHNILYTVIKFNQMEIFKLILEKDKKSIGQPILSMIDDDYNIPIFYAVEFESIEAIKTILSYSKNILHINKEGNNILHLCILKNNIDILKLLLTYISNINIQNKAGETILHIAIKNKYIEIINFLLEKNIDFNIQTKIGFTILHYICTI